MKKFILIIALLFAFSTSAFAQEKKAEVPFRADAGLINAEYYLSTGKYSQAIDVIGGVLQRHPQNADAYTYRGYAYQQLGDYKKAAADFGHALQIDPAHLGANKYVGDLFLEAGSLSRAMEQLSAIKLICGQSMCEEQQELEADINRYKKQPKTKSK